MTNTLDTAGEQEEAGSGHGVDGAHAWVHAQGGAVDLEERELLLRCRRGDRRSFEPIVRKYMRAGAQFALGLTGNRDDALDLSQEAFARAYRSIGSFDPDRPFLPWYYRILRNLCLNHLARASRRHEVPLADVSATAGDEPGPEQSAEREELRSVVWQAVKSLGDDHREIIVLREFQGLSYAEISAVLGIPRGTVMSRLHAARTLLRAALSPVLSRRPGEEGAKPRETAGAGGEEESRDYA